MQETPPGRRNFNTLSSNKGRNNGRKEETGELTVGEPCTPYVMTKCNVNGEGEIEVRPTEIRKIPLLELRQKLLDKHFKYMRISI